MSLITLNAMSKSSSAMVDGTRATSADKTSMPAATSASFTSITSFCVVATSIEVSSATITAGTKFQMKLNGHDRFSSRPREYFTRQQIYDHHTGFGGLTGVEDSIAVYSFALKPEEHQPSGTCNFSRIDTAQLVQTGTTLAVPLHVYAVNYNVLRIMSGMGGLAYSN